MNQPLSHPSKVNAYKTGLGQMQEAFPEIVSAYNEYTAQCFSPGTLDTKQKQLIALGISLFANNEVCTLYHVQEAMDAGASQEQIMETVAVAAASGGGHALSQGVTRVQQAIADFQPGGIRQ